MYCNYELYIAMQVSFTRPHSVPQAPRGHLRSSTCPSVTSLAKSFSTGAVRTVAAKPLRTASSSACASQGPHTSYEKRMSVLKENAWPWSTYVSAVSRSLLFDVCSWYPWPRRWARYLPGSGGGGGGGGD